jgi:large subunit ribosomal protein L11
VEKGASLAGRETVAQVTAEQIAEIAKVKLVDLNTDDLEMAKLQVAGTARSMGISVAG